jgi:hypothetical protein
VRRAIAHRKPAQPPECGQVVARYPGVRVDRRMGEFLCLFPAAASERRGT